MPEGCPIRIEYSPSVLEEIRAATVEGICRFPRGGIEVGGILFGEIDGDTVRVLARRPVELHYAMGPSFLLSDRDEAEFVQALGAAAADPLLRGLEPVGWYHSHTRSGLSLSEQDRELHERNFPEPWQVALLVRPEPFGTAQATFFYREADGSLRAEPVEEFRLAPPVRARARAQRAAQTEALSEPGPVAAGEPVAAVHERIENRHALAARGPRVTVVRRRRRRSLWPSVALMAVLAMAGMVGGVSLARWQAERLHQQRDQRAPAPLDPIEPAAPATVTPAVADVAVPAPETPAPLAASPVERKIEQRESEPLPKTRRGPLRRFVLAQRRPAASGQASLPLPPQIGDAALAALRKPVPAGAISDGTPAPGPPAPPPESPKLTAKPVAPARRAGRLIWTGHLPAGSSLSIDGARASAGYLTGELPGAPVRVSVQPAELSGRGMRVYTANPQLARSVEPASAGNGWNATAYEFSPQRARGVLVVDPPAASSGWKSLVLRSNAELSVIIIDWQLAN